MERSRIPDSREAAAAEADTTRLSRASAARNDNLRSTSADDGTARPPVAGRSASRSSTRDGSTAAEAELECIFAEEEDGKVDL